MFKFLISLLLIASMGQLVQAKPHPISWMKHHPKLTAAVATLAATTAYEYAGMNYCSRGDVEQCVEGYGSRKAFVFIMGGIGAAMLPVAHACRINGGKGCEAIDYWVPATQVVLGSLDFHNYKPKEIENKDVK